MPAPPSADPRWRGAAAAQFARLTAELAIAIVFVAIGARAAAANDGARPPRLVGVPDDPRLFPPIAGGRPLRVALALHVINLASIDEVAQQFTLSAYLLASWRDSRLAWTPNGPADNLRRYHPEDIWTPALVILNAANRPQFYDIGISARPDGAVSYSARMDVTLSANFNLRKFPFDEQTLEVIVHPNRVNLGRVVFIAAPDAAWMTTEFETYSPLASWRLAGVGSRLDQAPGPRGGEISEMRFAIKLRRRWQFYLWKLCLPLLLMVCLSWSVFWIDPHDLGNQVQIAVTTILTIIAFGLALSFTLPRISYLTFLDAFFLTSYVFVFAAMLELMMVHVSYRRGQAHQATRIRRASRWAVPLAYVAMIAAMAIHFRI
ncbi:hypothetical protein IMX07_09775 [bacterium]|nr:hypothetical protein [bacterium]